jgi:hypothetical protein
MGLALPVRQTLFLVKASQRRCEILMAINVTAPCCLRYRSGTISVVRAASLNRIATMPLSAASDLRETA